MSRHIQNPGMFNAVILIFKMMRHIESPGIVRTVYSDIFRHIQGRAAIFSHVQAY